MFTYILPETVCGLAALAGELLVDKKLLSFFPIMLVQEEESNRRGPLTNRTTLGFIGAVVVT